MGVPRIAAVGEADEAVEGLLARHHALMRSLSPEESCHVMTAEALREGGARVYSLTLADGSVAAVGALKPLEGPERAVELKSMHVDAAQRGAGLGRVLLDCLLEEARMLGARLALLETGTAPEFAPARALYIGAGFETCAPFGDYVEDPLSTFMARLL